MDTLLYFVYSINVSSCGGSVSFVDLINGIDHVINRVKFTKRRSVIAIAISGPPNTATDSIVEEAVKENIVVVAAAGE